MRAKPYNVLKKRLTAWRAELRAEKSKYSQRMIRDTIAAIKAEMVACLRDQQP